MKILPFNREQILEIAEKYGTPFYIYDEKGIRENVRNLLRTFSWCDFREYFAVKATPTPYIMDILKEEGCGLDCSSMAELMAAEKCNVSGENIMFSSNNTPYEEYEKAMNMGAIINLDDITHIDFLKKHLYIPSTICLRYNPGTFAMWNNIIGEPGDAKFGFTKKQLFEGYKILKEEGVKKFGLHTMIVSNELDGRCFIEVAKMMFELVVEISRELSIDIDFLNLGGGLGIPYRPEEKPLDLKDISEHVKDLYEVLIIKDNIKPFKLFTEFGRFITGPYGYLVSKVIHKKEIYKNYIGLDATMADLMRPAIYGAYHHITVMGKEEHEATHKYDITGSLCENNDKFAIDRVLPSIDTGDIIVIHDTGAHGHAMGFNYNGKLRSPELVLNENGSVKLIRRRETFDDYFATVNISDQ